MNSLKVFSQNERSVLREIEKSCSENKGIVLFEAVKAMTQKFNLIQVKIV